MLNVLVSAVSGGDTINEAVSKYNDALAPWIAVIKERYNKKMEKAVDAIFRAANVDLSQVGVRPPEEETDG